MRSSGTSSPRPTVSSLIRSVGAVAVALLLAGCGSGGSSGDGPVAEPTATSCPGSSSGVTVPTINGFGGQSSPVAAAEYFAKHGNVGGVPATGWKLVLRNSDGAYLRSGNSIIHVSRGSDGTWLVSSERTCLP